MRIILTEDDHRLSKKHVWVLTRENYISEEALQLIEIFPYDLLILDIILPGVDGITLCRKLRARNYQIPILLLTAKNPIAILNTVASKTRPAPKRHEAIPAFTQQEKRAQATGKSFRVFFYF